MTYLLIKSRSIRIFFNCTIRARSVIYNTVIVKRELYFPGVTKSFFFLTGYYVFFSDLFIFCCVNICVLSFSCSWFNGFAVFIFILLNENVSTRDS